MKTDSARNTADLRDKLEKTLKENEGTLFQRPEGHPRMWEVCTNSQPAPNPGNFWVCTLHFFLILAVNYLTLKENERVWREERLKNRLFPVIYELINYFLIPTVNNSTCRLGKHLGFERDSKIA